MRYKIEWEGKEAAYLQLYRQLRSDIVDGVYPYHTRLPSKRTVKDECGVSLVTVDSLDAYPDYIKYDVEGAEYEALTKSL